MTTKKYETKKLTTTEEYAIKGMVIDGFTDEEIKEALNRSPNSKIVNKILKDFRDSQKPAAVSGPSEERIALWKPEVAQAVRDLEKLNIDSNLALSWISKIMKDIDLNQAPDKDIIISYVNARFGDEALLRERPGTVASTGLASKMQDEKPISVPNTTNRQVSTFPAKGK